MSDLDKMVDKFSGFITKEQAEFILKGENGAEPKSRTDARKSSMSVKELIGSIPPKKPQAKMSDSLEGNESLVNIKDSVYRIFNSSTTQVNGKETIRRTVILGEEGSTIALSVRDKLSEFIDVNAFERGDLVIVNNALFDSSKLELRSSPNTIINRASPSVSTVISDYSTVKEEKRKVDIVGRVVEISPIRYVTTLGKSGQVAVASCIITDSTNMMDASFWGSSAIKTTGFKPNDFIKVEFCDIRMRDGKLQVYATDDSRVAIHNSFGKRLPGQK
jgi:hypothetical protein